MKTENATAPNPPYRMAMLMEPCFHAPPFYDCKAKKGIDIGALVPHKELKFRRHKNLIEDLEDLQQQAGMGGYGVNEGKANIVLVGNMSVDVLSDMGGCGNAERHGVMGVVRNPPSAAKTNLDPAAKTNPAAPSTTKPNPIASPTTTIQTKTPSTSKIKPSHKLSHKPSPPQTQPPSPSQIPSNSNPNRHISHHNQYPTTAIDLAATKPTKNQTAPTY
ncbi:hypothetical protein Dsin_002525 [Dipteronia sinensis]|uniref:Fucosyltransferase n=1 Tax=Dipteronia sinensis TaxID=43782 RepID=A0AAE0B7P1_9ROSI|nr:hypothetical protein Dsin_002525 [Dipteronia sinensis]